MNTSRDARGEIAKLCLHAAGGLKARENIADDIAAGRRRLNEQAPAIRQLPMPHTDLRFCAIGASSFLGAAIDALLQAGIKVVSIASQSAPDQPEGPIESYLAARDLHESIGGIVNGLRLPFVHAPDPNAPASIAAIRQTTANAVL